MSQEHELGYQQLTRSLLDLSTPAFLSTVTRRRCYSGPQVEPDTRGWFLVISLAKDC
jgi:hypothetical protein